MVVMFNAKLDKVNNKIYVITQSNKFFKTITVYKLPTSTAQGVLQLRPALLVRNEVSAICFYDRCSNMTFSNITNLKGLFETKNHGSQLFPNHLTKNCGLWSVFFEDN